MKVFAFALLSVGCAVPLSADSLLHPLLDADEAGLRKVYESGAALPKSTSEKKLYESFTKDVGHARKFTSSRALFACASTMAYLRGFSDAKRYAAKDEGFKEVAALLPQRGEPPFVGFVVTLYAWPGVDDFSGAINRAPNAADVEEVTFVLKTQDDRVIHPAVEPKKPDVQVLSSTNSYVSYDSAGVWVNGKYTRIAVQSFGQEPAAGYAAVWTIIFPATDKDGRPVATERMPKLTLVTIRPHGELLTTFDLNALAKTVASK